MTDPTTLLEPSFAEVIAAIEQAVDMPAERRRHWVCSVQQIAKWLDRPTAVIPARFNAVEMAMRQLHHARLGVEAKTLAKIISRNLRGRRCAGSPRSTTCRGMVEHRCWILIHWITATLE